MSEHTQTAHFSKRVSEKRRKEQRDVDDDGSVNGWAKHTKEIEVTVSDDALPTVRFHAETEYEADSEEGETYDREFGWPRFTSLLEAVEYDSTDHAYGRAFLADVFGAYGTPTRLTDREEIDSDETTTLGIRDLTAVGDDSDEGITADETGAEDGDDGGEQRNYLHLFYDGSKGLIRLPRVRSTGGPPENIGTFVGERYVWEASPEELVAVLRESPAFQDGEGVEWDSESGFSPALRRALFVTRDPVVVEQLVRDGQ